MRRRVDLGAWVGLGIALVLLSLTKQIFLPFAVLFVDVGGRHLLSENAFWATWHDFPVPANDSLEYLGYAAV